MDILAMSFCVKSSHSHLSVSLKCQHLLGFEEEEQASAFIPPALTPNQSFQLRDLPGSQLHLLCQALCNPYCKIKDLKLWTCNLTRECCQDLCNARYANEHLRDLDPSDNALGDEGMQVLCEGLKQPSCKLQTLW